MNQAPPSSGTPTTEMYFTHYWEYAKLWRTWVVGIAAAALFILLNEEVGGRFESRALVATLFIAAAGAQVLAAWVNKTASFYGYLNERDQENGGEAGWWTRFWCRISNLYLIDFALDLFSLVLVAMAVVCMVTGLLSEDVSNVTTAVGTEP